MINVFDVPRSVYLFGARCASGSSTEAPHEGPVVGLVTGGAPCFGVAIASRSEVRGVRVAFGSLPGSVGGEAGPSRWIEVVEGAPVAFAVPIDSSVPIWLDRLDAHDGRLTLALATDPESALSLPVDVAPESSIVLGTADALTDASHVSLRTIHLAPPRVATGAARSLSGRLYNADGSVDATATLYAIARHSRTREVVLVSSSLATVTLTAAAQTEVTATGLSGFDHARCVIAGASGAGPVTGRLVMR